MLARQFPNLRLRHVAERKERAAELLLGQAEKKISLVLAGIGRSLEQPAASCLVKGHAGVVSCGHTRSANLLGHNQ